ncbi:MAG: ATP-binding protein [Anaerolineales bacterium]|nr:ATP-binding protein [Anaerolineales bacterium]MCS7247099.1 ATP-binding protein [Anaerolineales bacterium]MDW8160910.1 ATP-binding protein [Anaerolineales bacterium]MDW8447062.1 ATP-binding protein [Anaerolineales bacterium]
MSEGQVTLKELLAEPSRVEDLKIPQSIVLDIIFRLLFNEGNVALARFVEVLKISNRIIDEILAWMQKEHLVEVAKAIGDLGRLGYVYTLTEAGEERARAAFERSQYIGPVPVCIPDYNLGIEMQTNRRRYVQAAQVKEALRGLILPEDFHRRIGPAINSGSSLFLYGPPGNGKTTVAQAISRLISGTDPIWLPYAITAGGHIIQIHDRLIHHPAKPDAQSRAELGRIDGRWALFHRPTVMVGGELKMESLDLRYDPVAKIYEAPLQLKANGGMFLIDDFGRQQVRPNDLLNRWIVPLENQVDFLRLVSGQTLVVPFRLLLVFSTNLDPHALMDDAFLRRIQIKVELPSPDEKMFAQIFLLECKNQNIPFNKEAFVYLLNKWYKQSERVMQAVHPRDLLRTIKAICDYEGIPPAMTPELLDQACKSYFVS